MNSRTAFLVGRRILTVVAIASAITLVSERMVTAAFTTTTFVSSGSIAAAAGSLMESGQFSMSSTFARAMITLRPFSSVTSSTRAFEPDSSTRGSGGSALTEPSSPK